MGETPRTDPGVAIPKDPDERAALAELAGLTTEERAALEQFVAWEEAGEPADWSTLAPPPKCSRCGGSGSAAPSIPGLLNYIRCNPCGGTGIEGGAR